MTPLIQAALIGSILISFFGMVAACVIAYASRRHSSRAATLVAIALALHIIPQLGSWVIGFVAPRFIGRSQYTMIEAALGPIWVVLGVSSLILFVRAAFIDREKRVAFVNVEESSHGVNPSHRASPYAAPSQTSGN